MWVGLSISDQHQSRHSTRAFGDHRRPLFCGDSVAFGLSVEVRNRTGSDDRPSSAVEVSVHGGETEDKPTARNGACEGEYRCVLGAELY